VKGNALNKCNQEYGKKLMKPGSRAFHRRKLGCRKQMYKEGKIQPTIMVFAPKEPEGKPILPYINRKLIRESY